MAYQYQRPDFDPNRRNYGNNNRNNRPKSDVGYWVTAGLFLFLGGGWGWIVSLIMLIAKLSSDKKMDEAANKIQQRMDNRRSSNYNGLNANQMSFAQQETAAKKKESRKIEDTVLRKPKKGGKVLYAIGLVAMLVGLLTAVGPLREMIAWGYYSYLLDDLLRAIGIMLCGGCMWAVGRGMKKKDVRIGQYLGVISNQRIIMVKNLASVAGVSMRTAYHDLQDMIDNGQLPAGAYLDKSKQCLVLDPAAMPYQEATPVAAAPAADATAQPEKKESTAAEPANEYEKILAEIRQVNNAIKDEAMSAKIYHIEDITRSIFTIVEEKPERRTEIRSFFNYYLPTTQKLLNFYAQLEAQPVQSQTIVESKHNIEGIMDNLVKGFESQLDGLFRTDAMDISSDISVLENMLAQDGLAASTDGIAQAAAKSVEKKNKPVQKPSELSSSGGMGTAVATMPMENKQAEE